MDDERENFSTAASNILLRNNQELVYWWGDWEDSGNFYTIEAEIQKKYKEKFCQSIKKQKGIKKKDSSIDSWGEEVFNEVE